MVANRLVEIFSLMASRDGADVRVASLCGVAAEITGLDGAGIALWSDDDNMTSLCTSDEIALQLMTLELTLREGPGCDASASGAAVEVVDLEATSPPHWLAYGPRALEVGARAVFGFPLRIGSVRFGALTFYRGAPGHLSAAQASDAYLMASIVGRAVLELQAGSPLHGFIGELNGQSTLDFRVHQAAGMIAVQGHITVKAALILIRAHAFASEVQLNELAEQIITRRTRFDRDLESWIDVDTTEESA